MLCILNTQSFFGFLLIFLPALKESNQIWGILNRMQIQKENTAYALSLVKYFHTHSKKI